MAVEKHLVSDDHLTSSFPTLWESTNVLQTMSCLSLSLASFLWLLHSFALWPLLDQGLLLPDWLLEPCANTSSRCFVPFVHLFLVMALTLAQFLKTVHAPAKDDDSINLVVVLLVGEGLELHDVVDLDGLSVELMTRSLLCCSCVLYLTCNQQPAEPWRISMTSASRMMTY